MNDTRHLTDYLFVQLGICRVGDILLLNRRIYKGNIVMPVIIFFVINTNAFLKDEFYPLFANTIAKSCTNSDEAQGAPGTNSCIPQKYW